MCVSMYFHVFLCVPCIPCVCMCVHVCACVFPCISMCVSMYFHVFPCVSMCVHVFPCVSMCVHVYICVSMFFHVCSCVFTCIFLRLWPSLCVHVCFHVFPSVSMCFHVCFHVFPCVYGLPCGSICISMYFHVCPCEFPCVSLCLWPSCEYVVCVGALGLPAQPWQAVGQQSTELLQECGMRGTPGSVSKGSSAGLPFPSNKTSQGTLGSAVPWLLCPEWLWSCRAQAALCHPQAPSSSSFIPLSPDFPLNRSCQGWAGQELSRARRG
uniref:Uncharacterized protein n=1 Tax=Junco hyemalis TaxID=40217 RepID=A0A8C5IQ70_JUNHY